MQVTLREGREKVDNEPHVCRPRTSTSEDKQTDVGTLVRKNRKITVRIFLKNLKINVGSVETIVKYHILNLAKRVVLDRFPAFRNLNTKIEDSAVKQFQQQRRWR